MKPIGSRSIDIGKSEIVTALAFIIGLKTMGDTAMDA